MRARSRTANSTSDRRVGSSNVDEEGIGPEDVVALPPTRSIERVVQLWAVAKTGAAFGEHDHRSQGQ
ncbi:hypothetical protein GS448_26165 [Rhodococcus hoagii]|nr:hypothetical protein [Prescottella equi]